MTGLVSSLASQLSVCLALGLVALLGIVSVLSLKNKELREWALRKQAALNSEGLTVGPRTLKLLDAMRTPSLAEPVARLKNVNKFGVPVSRTKLTPKKLSRKQLNSAKV